MAKSNIFKLSGGSRGAGRGPDPCKEMFFYISQPLPYKYLYFSDVKSIGNMQGNVTTP